MARLRKIDIEGFRSIRSASVELQGLNVLIGANGAGKSNFISFFKMLNEMLGGRFQQYVGVSGFANSILHFGAKATQQIHAELEFEIDNEVNGYSLRLTHGGGDILLFADEHLRFRGTDSTRTVEVPLGAGHRETAITEAANRGEKVAGVFRHLLSQCRVYHFHDTSPSARLRQSCYIDGNRWLMPDAGNLAAMLHLYQQNHAMVYQRIVATIRKITPEFDDFVLAPNRLNSKQILLEWRKIGSDYVFGPHQISDGTLRAMAIVTLLLQPEDDLPDVIILDEPELGLHPYALEIVAGLLQAASEKSQILVATQSQAIVDYFEPENIITVESVNGCSEFQRLDASQLQEWLEDYSLGELWQRNVIGGSPLP